MLSPVHSCSGRYSRQTLLLTHHQSILAHLPEWILLSHFKTDSQDIKTPKELLWVSFQWVSFLLRLSLTLSLCLACRGINMAQCSLELLGSSYPPTSVPWVVGTTLVYHHGWLSFFFSFLFFLNKSRVFFMLPRLVLNSWPQVIFFFWHGVSLCCPGRSAVVQSWLTATLTR